MGDINPIEILFYMINFLVTFGLLYLLLYRPVSRFLAARRERIAAALREAEEARQEAEVTLNEAKAELTGAGERARQLSHETIESAALDAERIIDNAQDEADALLVRAREQVVAERQAAQERALTELVSLAGELASHILSREVSLEDNRSIAEHFFQERVEQAEQKRAAASSGENRP